MYHGKLEAYPNHTSKIKGRKQWLGSQQPYRQSKDQKKLPNAQFFRQLCVRDANEQTTKHWPRTVKTVSTRKQRKNTSENSHSLGQTASFAVAQGGMLGDVYVCCHANDWKTVWN